MNAACDALGASRATVYRRRTPRPRKPRAPGRALSAAERERILAVLCEERFQDASPGQVYATLLEEGVYVGSVSTMYRVLRAARAVRERRPVRRHPVHHRPELVSSGPNQVWSWDITKVRGAHRREWFHLYVIIDIFSRYVVGWLLAESETASLAERFIGETLDKYDLETTALTIHSDRGTSMKSKTVAEFLADMGITKSHSRPRTSNDNPFSEAQFKTTKYNPYFPGSFASIAEAREYFGLFFRWYNEEHHHSGIAMLTPATVHTARVDEVLSVRQASLDAAYAAHPERFVNGPPKAARPAPEVWINRPQQQLELNVARLSTTSAVGAGAPPDPASGSQGALQLGHPCEPEARADTALNVAQ